MKIKLSAALILSTLVPAIALFAATTPPLTPNSQKYSNAGAHPATGRSGSAAIEVRALLGKDHKTQIEVTTGTLDSAAVPAGRIAKLQVKLLSAQNAVIATDNYRKLLEGTGYAKVGYDGLGRGAAFQVQASVDGIDPNRADVVTVEERVRLRPDVAVVEVSAPQRVPKDHPFEVTAVLRELNGEVGARSNCVLYADGVERKRADGIWVDAAGTVTCAFGTLSFASIGAVNLEVRAESVLPCDYDLANNVASVTVDIFNPTSAFSYYNALAGEFEYDFHSRYAWSSTTGAFTYQWEGSSGGSGKYNQSGFRGIYSNDGRPTFPLSRLTLRETVDGAQVVSFDLFNVVKNMNSGSSECYYDWTNYVYATVCAGGGATSVELGRYAGQVTYYANGRFTSNDPSSSSYSFNDGPSTSVGGIPFSIGQLHAFDVSLTDSTGATYTASPQVLVPSESTIYSSSQPWTCSREADATHSAEYCSESTNYQKLRIGSITFEQH